jgi:hypothetical protein
MGNTREGCEGFLKLGKALLKVGKDPLPSCHMRTAEAFIHRVQSKIYFM